MSIVDVLIPFTIALFIIAGGVIFLYLNFQKNLVQLELEKAAIEAKQRDELLRNSIMVQEEERKRIAGDLHDELGAVISIIKMNLMLMKQKPDDTPTDGKFGKNVENLISLSNTAITSVRSISHQLMPPELEMFGLVKTIESVIAQINQSDELKADLTVKCEWPVLKWEVALGIYRILMELINNTIKHAQASNIFIEFDCLDGLLIINFEDDGVGFPDGGQYKKGLGSISMNARAKALNGEFEYLNGTNNGVKVVLKVPVN